MLTTTVSVTVKLTPSETKLLRFFADQCPPPRQGKRMYAALNSQGLIHRQGEGTRLRYDITELGRQTVAELDRTANLPPSHQLHQPATAPPPNTSNTGSRTELAIPSRERRDTPRK